MSTEYQLSKDQQRLADFSSDSEITSLEREISLMRLILENAAKDENTGQVLAAASVLARLVQVHESAMARKDHWISKRVLLDVVVPQWIAAINAAVSHLDGYEKIIDAVLYGMGMSVATAHNETGDVKLITGKRNS